METKNIFLSHILDKDTPTYANESQFKCYLNASIKKGKVANESFIHSPAHIGTHIDLPLHFYEDAQDISFYDANFWIFKNPLVLEIKPENKIIENELRELIENIGENPNIDILIVKTGMEKYRNEKRYYDDNYGFSPNLYEIILRYFPNIKVFGFDTISISTLEYKEIGRKAHQIFLNPSRAILILEDMHLKNIDEKTILKKIIVSPIRISNCDGLPCTVIGEIEQKEELK